MHRFVSHRRGRRSLDLIARIYLASEVTLLNIRNARKVFEKLEKGVARH